jgi:hypothetical protein
MLQGAYHEDVADECLAEAQTVQQKICRPELTVGWIKDWQQLHVLEEIL